MPTHSPVLLSLLPATDGDIDLRTANGTANSAPSGSTFTSITLRQNSAFGATAPLIFPATLNSLTLTTAAAQTVQGWMVATGRALSVTSGGVLTVNSNISTPDSLTLATTGTGSAGRIVLNSDIINLDPAADGSGGVLTLAAPGGINFTHANGLTLTALSVTLNGDVTSINLPFTATTITGVLTVEGDINTGTGNITLSGVNNIQLSADVTLTGGDVALTGSRVSGDNFDLRVVANGDITLNIRTSFGEINLGTGLFDLRAGGNIINAGTARAITAGDVFLQQTAAFADNLFAATGNSVSGSVDLRLTTAGVSQTIQPWMALGDGDFSLAGVDGVRLDAITLATALTFTGEIDLRALGIFLTGTGALTGTVINLRADNVFQQNTGALVAIHASTGDITATRITATGAAATGVPVLGGTTSFSLEQTTAFGALDTLPFTFVDGEITAITISTRSAQAVQTWMVASGRTLSLTTSGVLTVGVSAISPNTGGLTGNLTLSGASIVSTHAAGLEITANDVTLTGDITLTGTGSAARRFLAVAGGGGNLTLSGSIFAGASDITLDVVGSGEIILGSTVELRGGVIRLNSAVSSTNNHALSVFADGNIFLGGNITLGSGALLLSTDEDNSGFGNISNLGGTVPVLMVGDLTLRRVGAFADNQFASGSTASGAVVLRLRTAAIQPVHGWMAGLGTGAFSLRGVDGVTLTAINTTAGLTRTVGAVDLRATEINVGGDITASVGSLTLQATTINLTADVALFGGVSLSLTGAIDESGTQGNEDFSVSSIVNVILNSNINLGTGELSLFAPGVIILASDIVLDVGTLTLVDQGMFDGSAVNADLTINASENLTLGSVNLGTGDLIVNNMSTTNATTASVASTWTAGAITLTGAISANNLNLDIVASGLLTLNNDINIGTGNLDINAMGGITLGGPVTLTTGAAILRGAVDGTNGNHNFAIMATRVISLFNDISLGTGDLTLDNSDASANGNIVINNEDNAPPVEIILSAGNITLVADIEIRSTPIGINSLSVRARGNITLGGGRILRGFVRLELRADDNFDGTGTIINGGTAVNIFNQPMVPMNLLLQQAGPFPADLLTDNSQLGGGTADLRITNTGQTQAIHPWMELAASSFTLRGNEGEGMRAAVVLTAITIGETTLNYGTTDIDLQAAAITLTAATTLTGGAISLTGALTAADLALTITASGLLTLNSDINLGTGMAGGILTINAGDRINVPTSGTTITASANNIIFTDRLVQSDEAGFTPAGSTTSTFNNMIFVPPATSTFPPPPCPVGEADCSLGTGAALIVDPLLEASASITLNAGTNALSFSGEGAITITSPIITITAGSIDIGTRSLTITAADGTITLAGVTSITGTGAASLSLDATTIAGLSSALTVNVPNISLAQEAVFGGSAPFTIPATGISSLALTTAADQTVQGWMVVDGRSLSLTSTGGRITATADINAGTGDIILNGARGLTLGRVIGLSNITLTGGDVGLTGAINGDGGNGNRGFTVLASGVLTLNSDLNIRSGNVLGLTGTGGIILGDDITISGARTVNLNSAVEGAGNSLTIRTTGGIAVIGNINLGDGNLILIAGEGIGNGNLTPSGIRTLTAASVRLGQDDPFNEWAIVSPILILTTDDPQPVFAWMLPAGTNRALSITSGGDITVGSGMDLSRVDLTLQAATIILESDLTALSVALRARAITRDDANLTITATTGGITGNAPALDSTVTALTLIAQSAFGSSAPFTFDAALASLTLQTAAAQTVHSWMGVSGSNLSLTSTGVITVNTNIALGTGNLSLTGATIQIARAQSEAAGITRTLTGASITLTADDGILLGRFTGSGFFRSNNGDVASLTVTASGVLTIAADITAADGIRSGGDIRFVGSDAASPIAFTGARTITGRAIELTGVATGTADLTITASGTLTLNNDITLTGAGFTLALSGAGAIARTGRPRLTADMVSLAQVDAFPVTRTLRVIPGSSLAITAEAAQDVHDWMIRENIGLTVTSSNRVRVVALIGTGGAAGRNLGTGNITLTSTGGAVRILAGISTTGSITLIGVTGGINFNSGAGAKTFSGAAITLSGDVRSDRDLAITASGTLRINNDINIGTNALTLTSGVGAIVATGRPRLTAGMVSFSQVDALPVTRPFRLSLAPRWRSPPRRRKTCTIG